MKGDFTRNTFNPAQHFSRVLMQQGRVQLDADWNEQADIALHYLRALAVDLIGPHGGPAAGLLVQELKDANGTAAPFDFLVGPGNYYVNGVLCESEAAGTGYQSQSGFGVNPALPKLTQGTWLVYLDVWERHLTELEVDGIRETALGGPDTASRARVEWQVKAALMGAKDAPQSFKAEYAAFLKALEAKGLAQANTGELMAAVPPAREQSDACVISADNRFRGQENQLYRVEIHRGGKAWNPAVPGDVHAAATFKWSRENGSVLFAVNDVHVSSTANGAGVTTVTLADFGRDAKLGLAKDDWVELIDDDYVLRNDAQPLLKVLETDSETMSVILDGQPGAGIGTDPARHPLLRRWDQVIDPAGKLADAGAPLVVADASGAGLWLKLEDGIQVRFRADQRYNTGDYWTFPARTGTGDIEWPRKPDPVRMGETLPDWVRARGVAHGYAPLAVLVFDGAGKLDTKKFIDLRRVLIPLWT